MNSKKFQQVKSLFLEVCDLSPDERNRLLDERCGDDALLRTAVEKLLAHDADPVSLGEGAMPRAQLEQFFDEFSEVSGEDRARSDHLPDTIGNYRILSRLGEGGFGTVFQAEQQIPVRRIVAIKVIKRGMDTKQVIARFEAERQTLAMMNHPGIATVFDAGQTETGQAYFVMEYVAGQSVTSFCDARRLNTVERIALFAKICDAVRHAHIKGVIHRDIKPSNIIVADGGNEATALPKIIDFGIAKATGPDSVANTAWTQEGQFLGTPAYMSPEQAMSSGAPIDTRSDIYSLGVLLYEMLTGTTPFDSTALHLGGVAEMQRIIRDVDPPRPSTRFSPSTRWSTGAEKSVGDGETGGSQTFSNAAARRNDPASLRKHLRGDLDWIVMTSLEKDPARRYQSVGEFVSDLTRYLDDKPVSARPPTFGYRLGKHARRNRGALAAGIAILVVLTAGVVTSGIGWSNAIAERSRADAEASVALAVQEFLTDDLLRAVSPEEQGHAVSMKSVLDTAATRIENRFVDQPRVELAIRVAIGSTYRALGLMSDALPHLTRARELAKATLPELDPDAIEADFEFSKLQLWSANYVEAERLLRDVLRRQIQVRGELDRKTVETMTELAAVLMEQQQYDQSIVFFDRAHNIAVEIAGPESELTINTMRGLAMVQNDRERADGAEPNPETTVLYRKVFELSRAVHGPDHLLTVQRMGDFASRLASTGRADLAKPLCLDALEQKKKVMGEHHPSTLRTVMALAAIEMRLGQGDVAADLLVGVITAAQKSYAPGDPTSVRPVLLLADIRAEQQRFDESELLLLEAIAKIDDSPENFPPRAAIATALVRLYKTWGKPEQAARWQAQFQHANDH